MTAFSLKTAFRNDISLHDFAEKADYVPPAPAAAVDHAFGIDCVRFDATHPDYEAVAVAFGLTADDSVILASMPLNSAGKILPFKPKTGGQIFLKTSGEQWVIQNSRENRFGHWEIGVTKATKNAGDNP